jgi:hypothetical protein
VVFRANAELDLSKGACVNLSQALDGKTLSIKDSEVQSCDFRGSVTDGSSTVTVNANYVKVESFKGRTVTFTTNNSCNFVLIKAY